MLTVPKATLCISRPKDTNGKAKALMKQTFGFPTLTFTLLDPATTLAVSSTAHMPVLCFQGPMNHLFSTDQEVLWKSLLVCLGFFSATRI